MTDLARLPFHVTAHSSADALEAAKTAAREEGYVIKGVSRVDAVDMSRDRWVVLLTVREREVETS